MQGTFGSPFVRAYYQGVEIEEPIEDFRYEADEDNDDTARLTIKSDDPNEPDKKQWQEKEEITITWGYIGDPDVNTRKVYIQEVKWDFSETGVSGNIACTEKAISLKFQDSSEVYKQTTFPGLVKKVADRHGLRASIEQYTPQDGDGGELIFSTPTKPGEYLGSYLKRNNKNTRSGTIQRSTRIPLNWKPTTPVWNGSVAIPDSQNPLINKSPERKQFEAEMDAFLSGKPTKAFPAKDIVQGNKTDMELLKSEVAKEAGNYLVETRDDEIIIRKRNFLQEPYKSYKFRGHDGLLIKFTPESKIKSNIAHSSASGFSGWSAADKTFFGGQVGAYDEFSPTLTLFKRMRVLYKNLQNQGKGGLKLDLPIKVVKPFITPSNVDAYIDNAGDYKDLNQSNFTNLTVNDQVRALDKALEEAENLVNNQVYDPTTGSIGDAMQRADNRRKNAELRMNPASATLVLDTNIMPGKIITILNVSGKHSGNHYITKATHTISRNREALVEVELVAHGTNKKLGTTEVNSKGTVNKKIGEETNKPKTKKIQTTQNP